MPKRSEKQPEAPMVRLCLVCLQDYVGDTDTHNATPAHRAAEARSLHPTQKGGR